MLGCLLNNALKPTVKNFLFTYATGSTSRNWRKAKETAFWAPDKNEGKGKFTICPMDTYIRGTMNTRDETRRFFISRICCSTTF